MTTATSDSAIAERKRLRLHGCTLALVALMACGKSEPSVESSRALRPGVPAAPVVPAPLETVIRPPPGLGDGRPPQPAPETGKRVIGRHTFRHSSVRGDFRVYPTSAGVVVSWRTELSARGFDGKPLWRKPDLGRAVAVSADGHRLVANNDAGQLAVLDAGSGELLAPISQLGGESDRARKFVWISAFAWTPDARSIVAIDSKHAYVLRADGSFDHELPIECVYSCFSSAVAVSNVEIYIPDTSGSSLWSGTSIRFLTPSHTPHLLRLGLSPVAVLAHVEFQGYDPDLSRDGRRLVVDGNGRIAAFDARTLAVKWDVRLPGHDAVSFQRATGSSAEMWKPMPKQSPDGKYVAVNDQAGRLWLLDAEDGEPVLAYPTELVDFVEDVAWLDDATLVVITNDGKVARIEGTPPRVVWSEADAPAPERWD